ncbi:MAG TPA: tetratricopeptide repeat protein [Candidatus Competibacteraceae bacterium]|nr:tetratricopeptide repeat protein [Candidatus Competibacteraceae bacterium]
MMIRFIRRHALCVVLLVLGGGCGSRLSIAMLNPPSPAINAPIAVFPLRNATGAAEWDWISIGLQDSLTVDLWYVSALETRALPQMTEAVQAVCPDVTLACMAEQKIATWQAQAKTLGDGSFLWGEYWRDGDTWVLRLGWYGLAGDTPLAEHTERGASLPNLLAASTVSLQAILAAQGIAVTDAERARMSTPKTTVAAAWEHNARGYWAQIRWILAADEAQRTARVATWERDLRAAVEADPDYAEAWNNLGWQRYVLKAYGDAASPAPSPTNARFAFQQALRYKPDLIDARVGQGATLQALEKKTEALADYEKAVALNPSLAHHRKALLAAYQEAGQPEAGLAYLAALDAHLQRSGREDERTALYAWRIAYHTELKQWPQVLAAYQAWDDALARQTDEAHRYQRLELAQQLHDLGAQRHADGALGDAEAAYRQALAIREAVRGPEHLDVARSLNALAATLEKQGQTLEAAPLRQRAAALWKAALTAKQQAMGWEQLQGPAREWWQAFFEQNAEPRYRANSA